MQKIARRTRQIIVRVTINTFYHKILLLRIFCKPAIERETAGGTVKTIVKKEADGKVCYAVKYVKDGMEKTAKFTEEGKRQ